VSGRLPRYIPTDQDSVEYLRQHMAEQAKRDERPPVTGTDPQFDGHGDCLGRGCKECTS
jgi:hypothetical protein